MWTERATSRGRSTVGRCLLVHRGCRGADTPTCTDGGGWRWSRERHFMHSSRAQHRIIFLAAARWQANLAHLCLRISGRPQVFFDTGHGPSPGSSGSAWFQQEGRGVGHGRQVHGRGAVSRLLPPSGRGLSACLAALCVRRRHHQPQPRYATPTCMQTP